jgi:hypothetical protein
MPTRRPKAAPTSARVHRGLAAALVLGVLGGCAQVLGLEEWKQADCEDVAEDPAECEEPVSCSECLFETQACQADQVACSADVATCNLALECSQSCSSSSAKPPLDCIRGCCPMGGNGLYDKYLECLCGVCAEACGSAMTGCTEHCNPI